MKSLTCFLATYLYAAKAAAFLITCTYDVEWDEYRWDTSILVVTVFFASLFGLGKLEIAPPWLSFVAAFVVTLLVAFYGLPSGPCSPY